MFGLKRKLDSLEDLIELEKCLRVIYKTEDGTTCQALMTFEYISWRNKITRQLANASDTGEPICAFLCGYKLFFSKQTCCISQLLPTPCEQNKLRKRKFNDSLTVLETNCKHTCI
jgi:hypothetical protein